jgi:molybdopterin molybdotransferase
VSYPIDPAAIAVIMTGEVYRSRGQDVVIDGALKRVTASSLGARLPQPGYDQSIRDGFALAVGGKVTAEGLRFRVVDEAPAGGTRKVVLTEGTACRIMTGGMVPEGAVRVVPFEDCMVDGDAVTVSGKALGGRQTFIEAAGSQIAADEMIVEAGTILLPEHLAMLAATEHAAIRVVRRPRVGFFCTGSELVDTLEEVRPGLKISGNRYLLDGLIRQFLAEPEDMGRVADRRKDLAQLFENIAAGDFDAVISTGGMGPGKYDLLEEAFVSAGGEVLSRTLPMRPGQSTLIGRLDGKPFIGLPGPPGAVRTLMNEVVGPVLLQMQGMRDCGPVVAQARLRERVELKRSDLLLVKSGILSMAGDGGLVRLADRLEPPSCFILFPPGRENYPSGSEVEVHLVWSPEVARLFRG